MPAAQGLDFTVSVIVVRPVVAYLRSAGLDTAALLRAVHIDESLLEDSETRVPLVRLRELWLAAAQGTNDWDIGLHVSEHLDATSLDVFSYIAHSSATVGDAIRRACRYGRVLSDEVELDCVIQGDRAVLHYDQAPAAPRPVADYEIGLLVQLARVLSGSDLADTEAHFTYAHPPSTAEHARVLRIPVRFGRPRLEIRFPLSLMDMPMRGADERLCAILERQAEHMLERLPPVMGFAARARRAIATELERGDASLERVARRLAMSTRTLSRRLQAEGASHQTLLDELRYSLATRYLEEEGRTVTEVAFMLGFAEPSAFARAFRRWSGHSPRERHATRRVGKP